ncbi:alpha-1,4-glucan--maltose-1-phosphate maltosyltransferase [Streptomyces sp. WELS2]|uniref:alpha-1,4-glucan--maltose-1-phosphate maltosyltransferase n=1 Tax=Streptomyces sp. WELS2 TaxID=2749435 RepID=UPI0015F0CBA0|nr:alpha-1,4-glucan--maltose-1-phosphate maltosyltransferase [Streptomyces sp. WELS2]
MNRIVVEDVTPVVGEGLPGKAAVGEAVPVSAAVWREGHDAVGATLVWQGPDDPAPRHTAMSRSHDDVDRWHALLVPDHPGLWRFRVDGWDDPWATWCHGVRVKAGAGVNPGLLAVDLEDGARLLDEAADAATAGERLLLRGAAEALRRDGALIGERVAPALSEPVLRLMAERPVKRLRSPGRTYELWVDRERALSGAWYEFFPRSTGGRDAAGTPLHGTFATAAAELERVGAMGFDVVYLPPIHPIGRTNRKGRNNSVVARPGDPGSPWAIGSADGGHDAVHPELGTLDDFDAFVARARELGLEIALDLALQCSPDHPWVAEHPEWFTHKSDGSIAYAENPPKRYEDIYPLNFDNDREGLYAEVLRVVLHWVRHGVRIFRVDNPHTKPPDFWHWLIGEVKRSFPDVLFLAEAFTRPARLYGLARLGFTQSYTYFTWRETKAEIEAFGGELVAHAHECRPNLFVTTPDILPRSLQRAQPAMFAIRAALAATMAPTWGVYAGFELYESEPLAEGGEEYLNSEKYELRPRDFWGALDQGRSLQPWITRLNEIRRAHPALRQLRDLHFHPTDNDSLVAFSKRDPVSGDLVLVVVSLDPATVQEGTVAWDFHRLCLEPGTFAVLDEVSGDLFHWTEETYVKIEPMHQVAHIAAVVKA